MCMDSKEQSKNGFLAAAFLSITLLAMEELGVISQFVWLIIFAVAFLATFHYAIEYFTNRGDKVEPPEGIKCGTPRNKTSKEEDA